MSELKRLNALLAKLHEAEDELEAIIFERRDYFQTRSDRWQASAAAEAHEERTNFLEDAQGSVGEAIITLEGLDQ